MAKKQSLEKKKMIRAQSLQKKEDRAKEEAALLNRCLGLLGVLVAAVVGYACIRLLKMIAAKGKFGAFAYSCWAVGLLTVILTLVRG